MDIFDSNDAKSTENNEPDIFKMYGEELTAKEYITNPAISRESEIKKLIIVLLTPEKSGLLVGKPGIGKTAIVEGLAYLIRKGNIPKALNDYKVYKFNAVSLASKIKLKDREETVLTLLMKQLKTKSRVIIFIDETHTLIGKNESMDLANILKTGLDRGDVKAIGATTTIEYDQYIIRDRAFLRRFERIDVKEPDEETTVKILLGSLPKIEKHTGITLKYNNFINKKIMESIVSATSEYKRVYGLSAMYPDIAFSVLTQAFSQALFKNKEKVTIEDVYDAIRTSKRIYPDSILKELETFREEFSDLINEEDARLKEPTIEELQTEQDSGY